MIKNSFIYLFSTVLSKMIPFLLLPILTQYLTPQSYGILSIYTIFITMYTALISLNMPVVISKYFFKLDKQQMSIYISNIFILLFILFFIYTSLTFIIYKTTTSFFSIQSTWLLLLPMIAFLTTIYNLYMTLLRNEQKAYLFGIFEILFTILSVIITIFCLIVLDLNWYSRVIGILLSLTILSIISIRYLYINNYLNWSVQKNILLEILKLCIPLVPHLLGSLVISMSDRIFIEYLVGLEDVGIYSVGYTFGTVVMLFSTSFIKGWSPWFYKQLNNINIKMKYKIVSYTYLYIILLFIFAYIIALISIQILPYIVDMRYHKANDLILWISLGYAMFGIYQMFLPYLVHLGKTHFLGISSIVAAFINIILNAVFISKYGTVGAAYATFIAYTTSAFMVFLYQYKYYPMPWFKIN